MDDLGIAEVEAHVAAVQQHAGRLQPPHRLAHPVHPDRESVRIALYPNGGGGDGGVARHALESERVALGLRP